MKKLEKSQPMVTVSSHTLTGFWKAHCIKTVSLISLVLLGYLFWLWQHSHLKPNISPKPIARASKPNAHFNTILHAKHALATLPSDVKSPHSWVRLTKQLHPMSGP